MSDEEKKEYEELKSLLYTGTISQYGKRKLIEIIEKQSKEIEELKEEKYGLEEEVQIQAKNLMLCEDAIKETYTKWIDKIKAKIEEYEKALNILLQKNEWIEPSDTIIRNKFMHYIEFGQSLLEKE